MSVPTAPERTAEHEDVVSGRRAPRVSKLDGAFRALVFERLGRLSDGRLTLAEGGVAHQFGRPSRDLPDVAIEVRDPRLYRRIALGGALGAAEAYLDRDWDADDLTTVLRVFARNLEVPSTMEGGLARLVGLVERGRHFLRRNTRAGSRRNIAAHYDLGDDFYALFLDETMTYSCGVFDRPDATLRAASEAKYERICRKLGLNERDRVLEIGCGWGGFACHAATRYGCRVVAATISERQFEAASRRVRDLGLAERVEIVKRDYRDLAGTYDHVVSIEMIEAVGHDNLADFVRVVSDRLAPDGSAAIQAITIPDQYYDAYRRSVDFIQKHVFPGGCLVPTGRLTRLLGERTDLRLTHFESMPEHYARTLAHWRERFLARLDDARALGCDERFLRLWHYYLSYCEAGFHERAISVAQLVLAKPGARTDALLPAL